MPYSKKTFHMFNVSDLNKKYQYDYSVKRSIIKSFTTKQLDKKDPFQVVSIINHFIKINSWPWDTNTFYYCQRIEHLIQEQMPLHITGIKEIYFWITNNWDKDDQPEINNISLN